MNRRLTAVLIAALCLGACAVVPAPVYDEPVIVAPPPPRHEYPGYAPVVGYVWVSGYWVWTGHRHEWIAGRWVEPRPGYRWVAPRWEQQGRFWRQHEGRWMPDASAPRHAPPMVVQPRRDDHRWDDRRDDRHGQRAPVMPRERGEPPVMQRDRDDDPSRTGRGFDRDDGDRRGSPRMERGEVRYPGPQPSVRQAPERREPPPEARRDGRDGERDGRRDRDDRRRGPHGRDDDR